MIILIAYLAERWKNVKHGARVAWASIVFGFERALEGLHQAPEGTALCAYKAKLLELQTAKTISEGTAALAALESRLTALAETCTDMQAKQAIADDQRASLQIIVSTGGRFAVGIVEAAGASVEESLTEEPRRRASRGRRRG